MIQVDFNIIHGLYMCKVKVRRCQACGDDSWSFFFMTTDDFNKMCNNIQAESFGLGFTLLYVQMESHSWKLLKFLKWTC